MTEEVRLKGFTKRAPLDEVIAWLDAEITPLGVERVPFHAARGRVLAADIISQRNVPGFPRAAMDGYAVRPADLPGALTVTAELTAAEQPAAPVATGQAVRVMTGAQIPAGAEAVVMVEHARTDGDRVHIDARPAPGQHILRVGEDIAAGRPVLTAGRRLRPQDIALMVQAGVLEAAVRRRPQVTILPTGSELLAIGEHPTGSQVVESNSFMLEGLAHRDGALPVLHPAVRDDPETMKAIMAHTGTDVLVVSGGSSVGREDFTPVVANELGQVAFHGVALKPGSSTGIGRIGATWVVLGPGYPVAAYVAWDLIVRPLINRLLGAADRWPYKTIRARLATPYNKRAGRTEVARVVLDDGGDELPRASVLPGGSAILTTITRGDGFLLLREALGPLPVGEEVDVHLYD